ncbi:MAG: 2-oxo acid dehydrogenase subunit E2, partial [Actinobacteria bacterium]|nr:2-oxo acid dehydrogenase subunit E2 [Actinomycetota bacterium]
RELPGEETAKIKTPSTATKPEEGKAEESKDVEVSRVKISPLARKIASELGIDYEKEPIKGTGPGGRIVKEDILAYAEERKKKEQELKEGIAKEKVAVGEVGKEKVEEVSKEEIGEVKKEEVEAARAKAVAAGAMFEAKEPRVKSSVPLKGIRKVIAERMSYSKSNIPHIVLNGRADATQLIELRERLKDKVKSIYDVKITYTDFLLKICAIALRENLEINSSLQDGNYIIYDDVNVGLAVSIEEGLIVPTIYNCDRLGILEIAKKREEVVEKARKGQLKLEEIRNGTFTLTNLGMFGVRSFSAIINPPQAAILAVGEIYEAPAVVESKIEIKSFMELSLSCDHRIIDGAVGAKFLRRIIELIENPELLII